MSKIGAVFVLGLSLLALVGCSAPGTYGGQAYSTPASGLGGSGYPASPTQYQQPGPIASSSCGCQNH